MARLVRPLNRASVVLPALVGQAPLTNRRASPFDDLQMAHIIFLDLHAQLVLQQPQFAAVAGGGQAPEATIIKV